MTRKSCLRCGWPASFCWSLSVLWLRRIRRPWLRPMRRRRFEQWSIEYMQSIDDADPKLGATVWSPTSDVSFINPLGHERGWDEIASEVYGKLMGQSFTKRTLKNVGDVSIHVYGDAAVVEFDWDFVAILRSDGAVVHTTRRESQLYVNLPGSGWRLVHVHYSGPPVKEPGNGF
jgi:hypothetical protein